MTTNPISLSLIKPGAIDTPYKDHARNYIGLEPEFPPPVYAPETVAEAILHCAENPVRDVFIGGGGKAISFLGKYLPRTTDKAMEIGMGLQLSDQPTDKSRSEGLYESQDASLRQSGGHPGHVMQSSLYTKATLHPYITGTAIALLGASLGYTLLKRNQNNDQ